MTHPFVLASVLMGLVAAVPACTEPDTLQVGLTYEGVEAVPETLSTPMSTDGECTVHRLSAGGFEWQISLPESLSDSAQAGHLVVTDVGGADEQWGMAVFVPDRMPEVAERIEQDAPNAYANGALSGWCGW